MEELSVSSGVFPGREVDTKKRPVESHGSWGMKRCVVISELFVRLFLDGPNNTEQNHSTQEACEEAEYPATAFNIHTDQAEEEASEETADDTYHDIEADTLLGIGSLDLGCDPTSESADDDPTEY